jgi:molybdate transport system regulatory protein
LNPLETPLRPSQDGAMEHARLSLRIDIAGNRLGPGKIAVLEAIDREGSISAAGRALGMSYRRTWLLVDAVNHMFRSPAVRTQPGGKTGGAALTEWGHEIVRLYRAVEAVSARAAAAEIERLSAEAAPPAQIAI